MHTDEGSGEEHAHLYCDLHPALLRKVREDLSHSPSFLLTSVKRVKKRIISMRATELAEATMRAWEAIDMKALASYLSDDFVGWGFLPQPVQKAQYLDFMQAIMMAMPDWSFHDRLLDEGPVTGQGERALFVTQITGTHTGDLILPDLPIIPPTGAIISLPYRHLEYFVKEKTITTITGDFSPNALAEILAQMGIVLP
jgi:SnoaL-like domain